MSELQVIEEKNYSIETRIEQALVKENITDKIISGLKESYLPLKINGQDDKEGYKKVVEARKDCKGWRVLAKKVCKDGREDAVKEQKLWLETEKRVVGEIESVETYLETLEIEYEAEKNRLKAEADAKKELIAAHRYNQLISLGATTNGISYILEDVSYEILVIKGADEDIFNSTILTKYQEIFNRVEAEKAEAARIKAEFEAEQQRQREELERQQAELNAQREAFEKQQAEAARIENERLAREQAEKEKAEAEAKRVEQELFDSVFKERISKLKGWSYNGVNVIAPDGNIIGGKERVVGFSEAEFGQIVSTNIEYHKAKEAEAEEKRQAEIKAAEERAAQQERDRIAAEKQAAEEKKRQDELLEVERIANAKDKELWAEIVKYLENIPKYEFRSSQYRTKNKALRDFLTDLK